MNKALFVLISLFLLINTSVFAAETTKNTDPVPYEKDEFSQFAKDIRRAEIVSLGSMPFMVIGVTMAYGGYLYANGQVDSFPNPFDKGSDALSQEQQATIFVATFGIGVLIGITDYIVNVIKRKNAEKKLLLQQSKEGQINIVPVTIIDSQEDVERLNTAGEE